MAKIYKHYKGNRYEYIGECWHSETVEEMVIYKALYGEGKTWVRPKEMFFGNVQLADGSIVPRFALEVEDPILNANNKEEHEPAHTA